MEDLLSEFTVLRTYCRYIEEEGRRETWNEAVTRNMDYLFQDPRIPVKVKTKCKQFMLDKQVFSSMRGLWSSGIAADRNHIAMYNCSFLGIDNLSAWGEALLLLMSGTGVGFSCEHRFIDLLPKVEYQSNKPLVKIVVEDSREGWKHCLDTALATWFSGRDCSIDYSKLRGKGVPLKTMGGRSSGPSVLRELMQYCKEVILKAQGRKLTPLECHNTFCQLAVAIIAGGTRRSALISLSDLYDEEIRNCKHSDCHPRLYSANNSVAYHRKPTIMEFLAEWSSLVASSRGERGIANIYGARLNAPKRRKPDKIQGFNPCGEVALPNRGLCNLSSTVVRPDDDYESMRSKIEAASWLSLIQSTFTDFGEMSPEWKANAEEERLCGVSLSGQQDNPDLLTPEILRLLRSHAVNTCRKGAKILGINMPAAVTTTKPEGSCSLVAGSSAGCHPRWSKYYLKSVQVAVTDPLFHLVADQGIPYTIPQENGQCTAIIPFPVKSPDGAITRHDMTAMGQLEHYMKLTENYVEHNVSQTVYVAKDEWLKVGAWVWEHFDQVRGISFFPKETDGADYAWLPFREITETEYEKCIAEFPKLDFSKLPDYERDMGDQTIGSKEYACSGGACEL